MKKVFLVLVAILLMGSLPTTAAAAPQYKLRLQAFTPPPEVLYTMGVADFIKRVKEATNGRVEITPFPAGAVVPPNEIFKSVADGIVDMGLDSIGYTAGFMPFTTVLDGLPMSWQNVNDLQTCVRTKGLAELTQTEFEKRGVHFLGGGIPTMDTIIGTKPLRTQADFQGAKLRGWSAWNTFIKKLGASAVDMPLVDVYMALSMKTVDGAATAVVAHYTLKHYEVTKYLMMPVPVGGTMKDYIINLKTWKSMPADIQTAINKAMRDHEAYSAGEYSNHVATFVDKIKEKGIQLVKVDDPTWEWMKTKAIELWNETAAKDAVSAQAVKIMTDYMKGKGYIK